MADADATDIVARPTQTARDRFPGCAVIRWDPERVGDQQLWHVATCDHGYALIAATAARAVLRSPFSADQKWSLALWQRKAADLLPNDLNGAGILPVGQRRQLAALNAAGIPDLALAHLRLELVAQDGEQPAIELRTQADTVHFDSVKSAHGLNLRCAQVPSLQAGDAAIDARLGDALSGPTSLQLAHQ